MPITSSSTFTEITLTRKIETEDVRVDWASPDDNGSVPKALTDPDNADLAILQEVYASADGFGSSGLYLSGTTLPKSLVSLTSSLTASPTP